MNMLQQIMRKTPRLRHQLFSISARSQYSDAESPQPMQTEKSINQVTLLGRVGAEPQKRGSEKHPVVIFSLATNTRFDTSGEANARTDWHRISVFKPALREAVYAYLQKGQRVYVTGRIQYGEVRDEAGNIKPITSIIAEDVVFFQSNN